MYTLEVIAEVVYVLTKVYSVPHQESSGAIKRFLKARNIICKDEEIVFKALQLFGENSLDFVDNVLLAYHQVMGITIYSYDQKLMKAVMRSGMDESL